MIYLPDLKMLPYPPPDNYDQQLAIDEMPTILMTMIDPPKYDEFTINNPWADSDVMADYDR
jgi:hypothetical protein